MSPSRSWLIFTTTLCLLDAKIIHKPRDFRCSHLVVFGDNFSDDGAEAVGESHGFLRNSNGKIWSEYVNEMLQCDLYTNYAYSGAKSGMDNFYFSNWSGVAWQVSRYVENNPYSSEDPLIVLQTGGAIDFFTGEKDSGTVVENIHGTINKLTQSMASGTLLIFALFDLGSSPGVRTAEEGEELQQRLAELSAETNRQLTHIVWDSELGTKKLNPNLRIKMIDLNSIVLSAMHSLNTSEPFTHHNPDTLPRTIFQYAFHDLWSPSTIIHYQIAKEVVRQLQNL